MTKEYNWLKDIYKKKNRNKVKTILALCLKCELYNEFIMPVMMYKCENFQETNLETSKDQ